MEFALGFQWYNKSDLTIKYKAKLDMYILLYGDNATVYEVMNNG